MSHTQLEQMRQAFEDLERLEQVIQETLDDYPKHQKGKVEADHVISNSLKAAQERSKEILQRYEDRDGMRREEEASMQSDGDLHSFYQQLDQIRTYHTKHPTLEAEESSLLSSVEPRVQFSGEELYGKYVDLHRHFERFTSIMPEPRLDYLQYLARFSRPAKEIEGRLRRHDYQDYVAHLAAYLCDFFQRTNPLVDLAQILQPSFTALEEGSSSDGKDESATGESELDLDAVSSKEELEALGGERLKRELSRRGLKCGGTAKDRAKRLWAVRGLSSEEVPKKLRGPQWEAVQAAGGKAANGGGGAAAATVSAGTGESADPRDTVPFANAFPRSGERVAAWYETVIATLADVLHETIERTKQRIEKRQTLTLEELEHEAEVEDMDARGEEMEALEGDESDDDEDRVLYKGKKHLVLGHDGKPISYWLYRLHGLNIPFKCEICGDETYWGRRNYEKHFQEGHHTWRMRQLGIPNTRHFFGVTKINDAKKLWEQLRKDVDTKQWDPERDEEFEDSHGNVLDRRTYEDLARQGML